MLILLSEEIVRVKLCDLEKVFKLISFNYDFFCKYYDIKDNFIILCNLGIVFLVVDFIFFFLILIFLLLFLICKLLVCIFVSNFYISLCIFNVNLF